jgi:EpsI family protein
MIRANMQDSSRNMMQSVGLIVLTLAVYWPSSAALWDFWNDENHAGAHGPLVAALSVWALFRNRKRLAQAQAGPSLAAGALLVLFSAMWLVFWRAGIQELHILLLPLLMGLAVYATLGYAAALEVALPIGFLYFAVPAWGIFIHPLQQLTVYAVGVLAPVIGLPAQIDGNLVRLPGVGVFEIAGGCSGVNFLTAGLAVAVLVGEVERASLARRAFLICAMSVAAILSNWVRVLTIIEAGYTTHMRHVLVSRGHYMFGWLLFTVIVVAFVMVFTRPSATEIPVSDSPREGMPPGRATACVAAALALALLPLVTYGVAANVDPHVAAVAFSAPPGRAGWQGPLIGSREEWQPVFVGTHTQWHFAYKDPAGRTVEMVAIAYSTQAQGRELVNSENSLLGANGAISVAESTVNVGAGSYIETLSADGRGYRSVLWSVYDIGGQEFVTPLLSQLWYGLRSLGGPPYSVLFAFRATCEQSCDVARATLSDFLEAMGPGFLTAVARESRAARAMRSV